MLQQTLIEECAGETITAVHRPSNDSLVLVFASGRFAHIESVGVDYDGRNCSSQIQEGENRDPTDSDWQATGIFSQEEIATAMEAWKARAAEWHDKQEKQLRRQYESLRAKFEGK
jgi:hypothetical protein